MTDGDTWRPTRRRFSQLALTTALTGLASVAAPSVWSAAPSNKVKILTTAAPPDPAFHFYYYAQENGFYKEEGLDVELEALPVETNAVRATAAGDADATGPGAASTIKAIRGGAKLKIVANFWGSDYLIVAKNDIADLKALEGRTMAVSAPGAAVHTYSVMMMTKRGVDPGQVQWVGAGSSASRTQALIGGRVDAAIISSTFAAVAMAHGKYRIVADSSDDLPDWCWTFEVVHRDLLEKRPEAAQGLVNAYSRAVRWMYANPDQALAISQTILPDVPKDALSLTIHRLIAKKIVRQAGDVRRSAYDGVAHWLVEQGEIDATVDYATAVAPELIQRAIDKLGPVPS
jgi:NitT/TauT family transport system substrate-binding protein